MLRLLLWTYPHYSQTSCHKAFRASTPFGHGKLWPRAARLLLHQSLGWAPLLQYIEITARVNWSCTQLGVQLATSLQYMQTGRETVVAARNYYANTALKICLHHHHGRIQVHGSCTPCWTILGSLGFTKCPFFCALASHVAYDVDLCSHISNANMSALLLL